MAEPPSSTWPGQRIPARQWCASRAAPGQRSCGCLPGGRAGSFVVDGFRDVDVTGLQAVIDPGYPLVLAALALITIGVFVTMGRKIGDMKP